MVKKEVAEGINLIKEKYKNVEVNIATTAFDNTCFDYWSDMNLPIRTLQLPYYSCENEKIKYIIKNLPHNYNLEENILRAVKYKEVHNECSKC